MKKLEGDGNQDGGPLYQGINMKKYIQDVFTSKTMLQKLLQKYVIAWGRGMAHCLKKIYQEAAPDLSCQMMVML